MGKNAQQRKRLAGILKLAGESQPNDSTATMSETTSSYSQSQQQMYKTAPVTRKGSLTEEQIVEKAYEMQKTHLSKFWAPQLLQATPQQMCAELFFNFSMNRYQFYRNLAQLQRDNQHEQMSPLKTTDTEETLELTLDQVSQIGQVLGQDKGTFVTEVGELKNVKHEREVGFPEKSVDELDVREDLSDGLEVRDDLSELSELPMQNKAPGIEILSSGGSNNGERVEFQITVDDDQHVIELRQEMVATVDSVPFNYSISVDGTSIFRHGDFQATTVLPVIEEPEQEVEIVSSRDSNNDQRVDFQMTLDDEIPELRQELLETVDSLPFNYSISTAGGTSKFRHSDFQATSVLPVIEEPEQEVEIVIPATIEVIQDTKSAQACIKVDIGTPKKVPSADQLRAMVRAINEARNYETMLLEHRSQAENSLLQANYKLADTGLMLQNVRSIIHKELAALNLL